MKTNLKEQIRDALTRCTVNGMHLERINKEFILHETDKLIALFKQEMEKIIGDHENAMNENTINEGIPEEEVMTRNELKQEQHQRLQDLIEEKT